MSNIPLVERLGSIHDDFNKNNNTLHTARNIERTCIENGLSRVLVYKHSDRQHTAEIRGWWLLPVGPILATGTVPFQLINPPA